MDNIHVMQYGIPVIAGAVAGFTDIRQYKVYNWLTFPLIILGVVFHASFCTDGALVGLYYSLCGLALGFSVLLLFFLMGGVGAGDVKLMTGFGAWLGWRYTLELFLIAAVVMGIYSILLLVFFGGFRKLYDKIMLAVVQIQTQKASALFQDTEIIEDAVRDKDRRHLVPFAACAFIGVAWIFISCCVNGWSDEVLNL